MKILVFQILLKHVPKSHIDNEQALVQIMGRRHNDDKPLTEPLMFYFIDPYMRHSASKSL